jgi:hypothetical protein
MHHVLVDIYYNIKPKNAQKKVTKVLVIFLLGLEEGTFIYE